MLLNEIRYSIINTAKGGGVRTDDSRLSSRLVDYWIKYYRNFLIPEATNFGKILLPELIQDLGCQTLSDVDRAECVGALSSVEWDCDIKKVTIPALVDLPKDRGLIYVGAIGKSDPYDIITSEQESVYQHRLLASTKPRSYRIGTTLYVVTPSNYRLKYINVRGIFEDPTKVESCSTAGSCACFDSETTEFPFPDTLVPKLVAAVMERELHISSSNIDDLINDNTDNAKKAVYKR
mgnify:CR=1 FL=1